MSRVTAVIGGERYDAGRWDGVVLPAGTPATFQVVEGPARFVAVTSGGRFGRFFGDFAESVPLDRPVEESLATVLAVTGRHGVRVGG
jgi:hypothetical protein